MEFKDAPGGPMDLLQRRTVLAAGVTLLSAAAPRNSRAALSGLEGWNAAPGAAPPAFKFLTADGTERTLAEYAGQGVVLNFWATWCVPCVAEMPALDALARTGARERIAVLPLSSDRGGAAAVERFYKEKGIAALPVLLDPRGDAARAFGVRGIPTTVIIDRTGQDRGRLEGAADWSSPAALLALRAAFG